MSKKITEEIKFVWDLNVSTATINVLDNANIHKIDELIALKELELLKMNGLGRIRFTELLKALFDHGLMFEGYTKKQCEALIEYGSQRRSDIRRWAKARRDRDKDKRIQLLRNKTFKHQLEKTND